VRVSRRGVQGREWRSLSTCFGRRFGNGDEETARETRTPRTSSTRHHTRKVGDACRRKIKPRPGPPPMKGRASTECQASQEEPGSQHAQAVRGAFVPSPLATAEGAKYAGTGVATSRILNRTNRSRAPAGTGVKGRYAPDPPLARPRPRPKTETDAKIDRRAADRIGARLLEDTMPPSAGEVRVVQIHPVRSAVTHTFEQSRPMRGVQSLNDCRSITRPGRLSLCLLGGASSLIDGSRESRTVASRSRIRVARNFAPRATRIESYRRTPSKRTIALRQTSPREPYMS